MKKTLLTLLTALLLLGAMLSGPAWAAPEGLPPPLDALEGEEATETPPAEAPVEEPSEESPAEETPAEPEPVTEPEPVPPEEITPPAPPEEKPAESFFTGADGELLAEYYQQNAEGLEQHIQMIHFDLSAAALKAEAVTAQEWCGYLDTLPNIVARYEEENPERTVLAAINGGFFQPVYVEERSLIWNNLIQDGELIHLGDTGSTIGFDAAGNPYLQRLRINLRGGVNGHWDRGSGFIAWGINHVYDTPDAVAIFTPAYGEPIPANDFTKVVVIDDLITEIVSDNTLTVEIPANGFVVVTGDPKVLSRFAVGDRVEYLARWREYEPAGNSMTEVDWRYIDSALGAGPLLLRDGAIVLDAVSEGFTETKLVDTTSFMRSFIGLDAQGRLTLGTAGNMTLPELCEFLLAKGLTQAINLDGGRSSALYYNGNHLTPGLRTIADAIVISRDRV